jgi:DNA polymerase-3 subunit epsilon
MKKVEYAVVDIETTGGNAGGSRITEIAIIIYDGTEVTERWETLVNPEKEIPLPIFALTGITNEMVEGAPVFEDIAETVYVMLNGRIFVAHNVNFDYSFIRHQLEEAGYRWAAKKLCTVRAARKISPGLYSYSLGNLCHSLNIPLSNRHRAGGDADATAILLSRLLEWDEHGEIPKMIKKNAPDQRLPPNLPPEDFDQLPEKPGVYYFYNQAHKVIYVGKAINLKKRVASHFSGHKVNQQRQHFLRDIYNVSFEVCGTELMALLLECAEIKKLWPEYNSALKRFDPKFGLYEYEARSGHRYLAVGKPSKHQQCIELFHTEQEGITLLRKLALDFDIDHRFCKYRRPTEGEGTAVRTCDDLPDAAEHNYRVASAIESLGVDKPGFVIIDKGRTEDERSCMLVENGNFYGMGYVPHDSGFSSAEALKDFLVPQKSNRYIMQLLNGFAKKYPGKVIRHGAALQAL